MPSRVQVVFESQFGNAALIAHAIAAELSVVADAVTATGPATSGQADLLVVGAPTHMLTMSTRWSRGIARASGGTGAPGLREWLAAAPLDEVVAVAVFGTQSTRWSGSAARSAARLLRRRGATVVAMAEFLVSAQSGPLAPGEVERATEWARTLRGSLPQS